MLQNIMIPVRVKFRILPFTMSLVVIKHYKSASYLPINSCVVPFLSILTNAICTAFHFCCNLTSISIKKN